MSVGIKAAAFAGFLRFFAAAVMPAWEVWEPILIVLAVVTMIVGNVLALPQRNLKRLLAYSSIAHAGYLLLGLIAMGEAGTTYGASAVLVYLVAYTFMNVGAFGMLVFIRNRRVFRYGLDELRGYGRTAPVAALALTLFMLSLAGIPPTAGFWGKFYLFSAVVDAGQTWLAIVAVVMSAVSAFYYLRVVWYLYFEQAPQPAALVADVAGAVSVSGPVSGTVAADQADSAPAAGATVLAVSAAAEGPAGPAASSSAVPVVPALAEPDAGSGAAMLIAALGTLFIGIWPQPLLWAAEGAVRLISGG
jgi:proton-translocating NADH-quinone oxidoreductase chain N